MLLEPDDIRRAEEGLVFLDEALAAGPATHALIIGVGRYKSAQLSPISSTTVSARALADWFTARTGTAAFKNNARPLGSLALLLSEKDIPAGSRSTYGEGEVPPASFDHAKLAVRAWIRRINSNKENLAFLYIASHGDSHLGRTGFLFEDYGTDDLDATAGMSELEQFISSMENAVPIAQLLLFDCCRSRADIQLPWDTEYGTKLINLKKQSNDHGEERMVWAIPATSPGEVAIGRVGMTSVFAQSLLDALNGVAGDSSESGWPVRPGNLVDKLDKLLRLHRRSNESVQKPNGRFGGSFDICFPGESADLPVYLSLDDPEHWSDCIITVKAGEAVSVINGADQSTPFAVLSLPVLTNLEVDAHVGAKPFGSAHGRVNPPALFLQIAETANTAAAPKVTDLGGNRSVGGSAEIRIAVDSQVTIKAGAVCDVVRRDEPAKNPKHLTVPLGGETVVKVAPGPHVVTLNLPDGSVEIRDVIAAANKSVRLIFKTKDSPHEWANVAAATGSIGPLVIESAPAMPKDKPQLSDPRNDWLSEVRGETEPDHQPIGPESKPVDPALVGYLNIGLGRSGSDETIKLSVGDDDGRLVLVRIDDRLPKRFVSHGGKGGRPIFAEVRIGSRRELAVLPSLGHSTADRARGGWSPFLMVDRLAAESSTMTSIVVEDSEWAALLGFVSNRDMASGGRLLDNALGSAAERALKDKVSNPLAALCGGLVAVAGADRASERRWDPWLNNLAKWFPEIPDGPIILGRRQLIRARSTEQIEAAKANLLEGARRGVPIYSLAAEWLARGLESIDDEDEEFVTFRRAARRLADRIDPLKAFTIIRMEG